METNAVLLQNLNVEQLSKLMGDLFDVKLNEVLKKQNTQTENDDLMTREQVLELLQINASTLWHWTNKGRITVYKFSNKCYYKRSQLMTAITPLKK